MKSAFDYRANGDESQLVSEETGARLEIVNPKNTSRLCSERGSVERALPEKLKSTSLMAALVQPASTSKPEKSKWQVYFLRLTAFLSPSADFDTSNWWKDVVGEPPESQFTNPKLFEQTHVYTYKDGNLLLETKPGRIDWKFTYLSANQPFPDSADELQMEGQLLENFLAVVDRWFNIALPIIRLAFGPHFAIPVSDRTEGYQYLEPYLPSVKLDPANSSDLI